MCAENQTSEPKPSMSNQPKHSKLWDSAPLGIGIETSGGVMTPLIQRNTPLPCRATKMLTSSEDDQTEVTLQVLEGERAKSKDNKMIGSARLSGIDPRPKGVAQFEVTLELTKQGLLYVSIREKNSSLNSQVSFQLEHRTSEQVDEIVRTAEKFSREDQEYIQMVASRNSLQTYVQSIRDAATASNTASTLTNNEKEQLLKLCRSLLKWIESGLGRSATDFASKKEEFQNQCAEFLPKIFQSGQETLSGNESDDSLEPPDLMDIP